MAFQESYIILDQSGYPDSKKNANYTGDEFLILIIFTILSAVWIF